jgi:crotonobetainyl-CoA:carnitine CoA-transferase CaiB-like acyl-CoA transferase
MDLTQALDGLQIVEVATYLPGPVCTQMLAAMGATVTKIERPGGDPLRHMVGLAAMFAPLNDRKILIELDLKQPAGRAQLRDLASRADVLVDGLRPGALERLEVGATALSALNPRLIYCAISGYGLRGPQRERAGHDLNFVATSGLLDGTLAGAAPTIPGAQIADMLSGLTAVTAILAALQARQRTGQGGLLDVPMDAAAGWLLSPWYAVLQAGGTMGSELVGAQACYRLYACADGRYLAVAALEAHFWERFCRALERPDLIAQQHAIGAAQTALQQTIAAIIATSPLAAWAALFAEIDACVTPVRTVAEAAALAPHGIGLPVAAN